MNLSPIFSGAGHFKLGRPGLAVLFMLFESAGWIGFAAWAALSTSSPLAAGILLLATGCVRLLSLLHARRLQGRKGALLESLLFMIGAFAGELVAVWMIVGTSALIVYRIPSSAMEPTLLGPAGNSHEPCAYRHYHVTAAGDRIMVSRLAPLVEPIRRFDVVVFRFPLNRSRDFVKRVAGLPGEELVIRDGDLFARSGTEGKFRELGDLRISFRFQVPQGEVFAKVENGFGRFSARLSSDGRGLLGVGAKAVPLEGLRLNPGSWHSLDFSVRDGLAVLEVDGSAAASLEYAAFLEDTGRGKDSSGSLGFGAKGEGIRIRDLAVWQDVHYRGRREDWEEGTPLAIPPDSYVMLGDNVNSSHDSRSWKRVTFRFKDGRTVECEAQEVDNTRDVNPDPEGKQYDHFIAADASGNTVGYDSEDLVSQTSEPFHFVGRRFIKGKVMRIWWPPRRAGPVQ